MDYIIKITTKSINLFVDVLICFYGLEDTLQRGFDLRRELLFNLIVNNVLEGELYFVIFNLIASTYEEDLSNLKRIMSDSKTLNKWCTLDYLGIKP